MNVSATQPFQVIYSLFQHEYLGYLFESYVVHLDENGKLTYQHQNISAQNASDFARGLDDKDYRLIQLMDSIQQEAVIRRFSQKIQKPEEFFLKYYNQENGNATIQREIDNYLEIRRAKILENLAGKMVYEMGHDGEPAWKQLDVQRKKASVLFHFRRNEENTHYFPTIKHDGQKLDFQYKGAFIICKTPAWLVLDGKLFSFEKDLDGKKLQPFLNKKFIVIPRQVEETYFTKFVAPLIASFDVYAKGFQINAERYEPKPVLKLYMLQEAQPAALFGAPETEEPENTKLVFELHFQYGKFRFKADKTGVVNVKVEKNDDDYVFHRINRELTFEKNTLARLSEMGLEFRHSKAVMHKNKAFDWLNVFSQSLKDNGFILEQEQTDGKRYFYGESKIQIEFTESIDWFDIKAVIEFGEYKIEFKELQKHILSKKYEFELPNGEIAVIPDSWISEYSEVFALMQDDPQSGDKKLKKHHVALIKELESGNLAKVTLSQKLEKLRSFTEIDDFDMPLGFKGTLRPYQKSGYNWMRFLQAYNFGGCLADDMGLGKTVQTLALLQSEKEKGALNASLLVMPTSLVYNWQKEAEKFTPKLKVFVYTGTLRKKDPAQFAKYDLILTTYGIVRLDIDVLQGYYFNYTILDESQAIKNPGSNIAKAVRYLKSKNKLILSGTPLENSTMDIWSQMDFINAGLLGNKSFFKNIFLKPIEKKNDEKKIERLSSMIKPFILRRKKSQVATELPEKVENLHYCTMTPEQEEHYNEVKSFYRNQILQEINTGGLGASQLMVLQGLTKLRQIANHPILTDDQYKGGSGKMDDVLEMIESVIHKNHKILIFSQFVRYLHLFKDHFEKEGIPFTYLDGSTRDRQAQVERFQSDPNIPIFLISLKAGGVGLNLTKADYVFILDPWWNPAAEAQAIDRTHRIGQENKVFAYKFITQNTVEEKILTLQQKKLKLSTELISAEQSFIKSLTKEDIDAILS